MLFFRRVKPGLAPFLSQHLDDQIRVLGHFYDVKIISRDCDYAQECELFEPEITVFESGVYSYNQRIRNTNAHAEIPKLGFLHSDAYDLARAVFISKMAEWGIETFFTTSTSMAEYTPEIAQNLFVWPNSIDPHTFRDFGLAKNIPVLVTGSQERHYPWRNAVNRALAERFPTMTMPHFGWGNGTERLVVGTDYAKLLSASYFVPACGSMAREVVRKQLEIPAAGACLVTERSTRLEAFGFSDMVNCVFADQANVVEKLDDLWRDQDRLKGIITEGHNLVHSHHADANRSQVREWLELYRQRTPGQKIIQETPCSSLTLVDKSASAPILVGPGLDRVQLTDGWRLLRSHMLDDAEREFLKCLNYYFIPEAIPGLVFTSLAKGDAHAALGWATQALKRSMQDTGAIDPDPVLWACRIRALICAGEVSAAISSAKRYPHLKHIELDRVRLAVSELLSSTDYASPDVPIYGWEPRPSIAPVPVLDLHAWKQEFEQFLASCGQFESSPGEAGSGFQIRRSFRAKRLPLLQQLFPAAKRSFAGLLDSGTIVRLRMALSPLKQLLVGTAWSRRIKETVGRERLSRAIVIGRLDGTDRRALEWGRSLNPWLPLLDFSDSFSQADARGLLRGGGRYVLLLADFQLGPLIAPDAAEISKLAGFGLVLIRGTTTPDGYRTFSGLLESRCFTVVAHDPSKGTAVLRQSGLVDHGRATRPAADSDMAANTDGRSE